MKNWFTDLGAHVASNQGGICQDFEMRAMECIEYFGAKQGITACKVGLEEELERSRCIRYLMTCRTGMTTIWSVGAGPNRDSGSERCTRRGTLTIT